MRGRGLFAKGALGNDKRHKLQKINIELDQAVEGYDGDDPFSSNHRPSLGEETDDGRRIVFENRLVAADGLNHDTSGKGLPRWRSR